MPSSILTRKTGSSRIVWFASSNQWVYLEEPAWYVFSLMRRSFSTEIITQKCASRYNRSYKESLQFVREICEILDNFNNPLESKPQKFLSSDKINQLDFKPYSTRYYKVKNKFISITFDSRTSEYYIHPPLAHLEPVPLLLQKPDASFDIFQSKSTPLIRRKDFPGFSSSTEDFMKMKKKLYIEIANIIYHKSEDHWMSFLHASAVSNGKETILFSSSSGSGKSTMAALLQARGFNLVADDFIPVDAGTKRAWPFPAALSVKKGSFSILSPYYDNLQKKNYNLYPYTHSSVRYLHPVSAPAFSFKPLPVKTIIFICYNPEVSCSFSQLSIPEALQLFHEQAWVSHNPAHAKSFINWFLTLKCWKMEYSDNDKGINEIIKKF